MTDIKVGHFYEYRDNVQRYIVLATEVKARGEFMPAVFTGVVVFREGFNISDDNLAHEIGDVSENFYAICFIKVPNPLKNERTLDLNIQPGRFYRHTESDNIILVNSVVMYAGGSIEFTGIVVVGHPLGMTMTATSKCRDLVRIKNPLKVKNP